ncbi:HAD-IA family hydrolase [Pasteurellaceae bacterium LIM206]|nr:HAD-IA family hydrolase [Pasteurellaceae bacterium LIM206]
MKFYRTFTPYKVISFDLDDTLYDNSQVILNAEQNCLDFLNKISGINELTETCWQQWKQRTARQIPRLSEDVTAWRTKTIQTILKAYGKPAEEIEHIAAASMRHFLIWRHKIDVPVQSIRILNRLKTRYKLTALTNGNVDPVRIGLSQFDLILTGGKQGRAKPHSDLFHQTAEHFAVDPGEILHVGDNLITDVQGAVQAGCQAVWLNASGKALCHFDEVKTLPTVEINDLSELLNLA